MATKYINARQKQRIATANAWQSANPVLLKGEFGIESDTNQLKIGDGVTHWNDLIYFNGGGGDISDILQNYMSKADYAGTKPGYAKAAETADKLTTPVTINGVSFDGSQNITVADDTKIPLSQKGVANGVATLDDSGLIPSTQLPSYVDDVVEGYYYNNQFYTTAEHISTITPETGKIYVDITDPNNPVSYRWTGTAYVDIASPIDIATEEEAVAGTDNTKMMTPLRTEQAIAANYAAVTLYKKEVTLAASGWSNRQYVLSDNDIKAASIILFDAPVGADINEYNVLQNAVIVAASQTNGQLVLQSLGVVPTVDVTASLAIL